MIGTSRKVTLKIGIFSKLQIAEQSNLLNQFNCFPIPTLSIAHNLSKVIFLRNTYSIDLSFC